MVARITRILIVVQLIFAAAFSYLIHHRTAIPVAASVLLGVLIVVLVRMAIVANNFRIAGRFWKANGSTANLGVRRTVRMFFREWYASMWSSTWSMPFSATINETAGAMQGGLPVLLVHGFACNGGYWQSMQHALKHAGIPHRAIDLEPVFGDIDDYLPAVDQSVNDLVSDSGGKPVVIVGHSMGGLIARAYLSRYGSQRIARIITIGTPHYGTVLARYSRGRNCKQMDHDAISGRCSEWLQLLWDSHKTEERELITSIYSRHDNIIAPQSSCHIPDGRNFALDGIGHVELGRHPAIHALVIDEIRKAGIAFANGGSCSMSTANR